MTDNLIDIDELRYNDAPGKGQGRDYSRHSRRRNVMEDNHAQPQMPTPDPALKRLDRFVGTWSMEGHLVGSNEDNNQKTGQLPVVAILEHSIELDLMGIEIDSLELIGYDPQTNTFPSTVYSNLSPHTASVQVGGRRQHRDDLGYIQSAGRDPQGRVQRGGESFGGGWCPNPVPPRP
jgi:hypothetical protein